ncbi:UNVERIFIED_CONTAM: hypothetical protein NY100_29325, partial [Prevotella sp. 15_C9]
AKAAGDNFQQLQRFIQGSRFPNLDATGQKQMHMITPFAGGVPCPTTFAILPQKMADDNTKAPGQNGRALCILAMTCNYL